ncbi:MAG: uncharacterized protein A8A55_1327 [Amphiamblys sp. WSBS2006]|nr:MAG: uncharacterized protein A8A55_1327 [Amphiamblys sp. WSBS2006]
MEQITRLWKTLYRELKTENRNTEALLSRVVDSAVQHTDTFEYFAQTNILEFYIVTVLEQNKKHTLAHIAREVEAITMFILRNSPQKYKKTLRTVTRYFSLLLTPPISSPGMSLLPSLLALVSAHQKDPGAFSLVVDGCFVPLEYILHEKNAEKEQSLLVLNTVLNENTTKERTQTLLGKLATEWSSEKKIFYTTIDSLLCNTPQTELSLKQNFWYKATQNKNSPTETFRQSVKLLHKTKSAPLYTAGVQVLFRDCSRLFDFFVLNFIPERDLQTLLRVVLILEEHSPGTTAEGLLGHIPSVGGDRKNVRRNILARMKALDENFLQDYEAHVFAVEEKTEQKQEKSRLKISSRCGSVVGALLSDTIKSAGTVPPKEAHLIEKTILAMLNTNTSADILKLVSFFVTRLEETKKENHPELAAAFTKTVLTLIAFLQTKEMDSLFTQHPQSPSSQTAPL